MAEQLEKAGIETQAVPFVAKNLQGMASAVIESFSEHRIELFDDAALLADLRSLRVVEKSFGYRLDASRNAAGHADRAIALSIALFAARELPARSHLFERNEMMAEAFRTGRLPVGVPSIRDILGEHAHLIDELDADDPWPSTTGRVIRIGDGW